MALDDFDTDESESSDKNDSSEAHGSGSQTDILGGVVNLLTERAVKSDDATYEDEVICAHREEIAMWFGLIAMNYDEADIKEAIEE